MYKLPKGIRIPEKTEYPASENYDEIQKKRELANINEGYIIKAVENKKYTYIVEVNIDIDKLWDLFEKLSNNILPEIAYGIINLRDEKPVLSNFVKKEKIIELYLNYYYELLNDGFLEFGIAFYNDKIMNEIYVRSFKYIQIWTSNLKELINVFEEFNLKEYKILNFIDEFPVVSIALESNNEIKIKHYTDVFDEISKKFQKSYKN